MQLNDQTIGPFLQAWHEERHKCRTDLLYLCHEVLGYRDISRAVHGPILDALQHFPGAREFHRTVGDFGKAMQGKVLWEPLCQMEHLPPNEGFLQSRDTQILYPRGHLKSSLVTLAHSIQWILNYPNVRLLFTTATETLVTGFIIEIRSHFIQNEQLRQLFPECCPQAKDGKIPELGNLGGFTCPARDNANKKLGPGGKEPTVLASTVGSAITGYHGDVFFNDDLVEKINSGSQNGIDEVIRHFGSMWDMLEKYNSREDGVPLHGWQYTTGTPWDFSDLYQVRRNYQEEIKAKGLAETVNMVIRSAAPNWPDGPFLWPERMGKEALRAIEADPSRGPAQLAAQYLMNPIVAGQGLISDVSQIIWTPHAIMEQLLPRMTLYAALDLAGMDQGAKGSDNDYTCLTVGGFANARLYVPFMLHGRPPVEEVIEWIFRVFQRFPQIVKFKIEKEAHARVLLPFLKREMSQRNIWIPIEATPRNNQQSKEQKIRALRPWFQDGLLRFSDDLPYRTALEMEVKGFPKFRHNDILDTLRDLMDEGKGINAGVLSSRMQPVSTKDPVTSIFERLDRENFWEQSAAGGYDMETGWN